MKTVPKFQVGDLVIVDQNAPSILTRGVTGKIIERHYFIPPRKNSPYWYLITPEDDVDRAVFNNFAVYEEFLSLVLTPETNEVFRDIINDV